MLSSQRNRRHDIPDLRNDKEYSTTVKDGKATGMLYVKGNVMQVWWDCDILGRPFDNDNVDSIFANGRETWTFTDAKEAWEHYKSFAHRYDPNSTGLKDVVG
jgi:hypothetical protein